MIAAALLMLAQGPISKFDEKAPDLDYVSSASIYDTERCLIDRPGFVAPNVYRQPDRPNEVNLLWSNQFGITGIRVHLVKVDEGVRITSWGFKEKHLKGCAPPMN